MGNKVTVLNDHDVFRGLYEKTYRNAYYMAKKLVSDESLARDIVEDAYISLFRRLEHKNGTEAFNKALCKFVAEKCFEDLTSSDPFLFKRCANEVGEDIYGIFPGVKNCVVEIDVSNKMVSNSIKMSMGGLSKEQYMCIILLYCCNMDIEDIADVVNTDTLIIKSKLNDGRKAISEKISILCQNILLVRDIAPFILFTTLLSKDIGNVKIPVFKTTSVYSFISRELGGFGVEPEEMDADIRQAL